MASRRRPASICVTKAVAVFAEHGQALVEKLESAGEVTLVLVHAAEAVDGVRLDERDRAQSAHDGQALLKALAGLAEPVEFEVDVAEVGQRLRDPQPLAEVTVAGGALTQ
jgi:hypothetical protein